jgi:predicted SAM-dependent methyltransferase
METKGWTTLDIDPNVEPDITIDANLMEEEVPRDSIDYIYAEAITMDPEGMKGVTPARLLQQCNKALKLGGMLIIETANFENYPETTIPGKQTFLTLLQNHGFHGVAELHPMIKHGNTSERSQKVIYYGKKKRAGYKKIN